VRPAHHIEGLRFGVLRQRLPGPHCGDIPDPQAISTLHLPDERKQFAVRRRDRLFPHLRLQTVVIVRGRWSKKREENAQLANR